MVLAIRDAEEADLPEITRLLNHEIATGTGSWATAERTPEAMATWLAERTRAAYPTLVAEARGAFLGYAALGPFRQQEGFAPTAEVSVYVAPGARGGGVGSALLRAVENRARAEGFAALIGCVGADNDGSLRLHRRHGFAEAGRLPAVGRKFGRWLDLVLLIKRL